MDEPHRFSFPLPTHEITEELSEQVGHDNPLAVGVAKPLFDAGAQFAAITERPEFLRAEPWPRPWHTFYLVIQGEMRMTTGGKTCNWQAGDLAFCPAGVPFMRTGLPGRPVRWLYIRLNDTPAHAPPPTASSSSVSAFRHVPLRSRPQPAELLRRCSVNRG